MNTYSLLMAIAMTPLPGAIFLCAVSWITAGVCAYYGLRDAAQRDASGQASSGEAARNFTASYSMLQGARVLRDERTARIGWLFIVAALLLRGACALLALSEERFLHALFAFCLIAIPMLCSVGLFNLLAPCFQGDEAEQEEGDGEYAEATQKPLMPADAEAQHALPLARVLDRMTPRERSLTLSAFDAFILGGSVAALTWWLWGSRSALATLTPQASLTGVMRDMATVLWFVNAAWIALNFPTLAQSRLGLLLPDAALSTTAFSTTAFSTTIISPTSAPAETVTPSATLWQARQNALKPVWTALLAGSLIFGLVSAHLNSRTPIANVGANVMPLFDTLLLAAAALCYAAAAWYLVPDEVTASNVQANTQEPGSREMASSEIDVQEAASVDTGAPMLQAAFQVARNFLTLLLPCAAAAAGTWYAVHSRTQLPPGAVHGNALSGAEVWWDALLLLCASLRHLSLSLYENLYSSRQSQTLQRSVTALREEVTWRTQQLTTLHSVSADLNNTLSHEQVLNLALQRLMEAVRADAGAVWLLSNFEQIAADRTGESRSATSVGEEQKRRKSERENGGNRAGNGAVFNASSASPSTKSSTQSAGAKAVAPRLNLLDVFDSEQQNARVHPAPQAILKTTTSTEEQAEPSLEVMTRGKKRLNAAIQHFHALHELASTEGEESANSGVDFALRSGDNADDARQKSPDHASTGSLNSTLSLDVSGHGLRRNRPLHSSFRSDNEDGEDDADTSSALIELEGDGVYVSGPLGDWGTFVASSTAVADSDTASNPVVHRVSHTRDTYKMRATNEAASPLAKAALPASDTQPQDTQPEKNSTEKSRPSSSQDAPSARFVDAKNTSVENETSNGVLDDSAFVHRNWRLVRATGYNTPATNRTLEAMNRALEEGGIVKCARLSASWFGTIGDVHLATIRWHGEIVGVLSVTSRKRHFQNADRRLLEALASEVSGALRNSYIYQQARRWAERDSVTNLFNHRAMQEKLGQELVHARNRGSEVTVVMMDLNNFKFFNDTYGHPVGDQVLVTVAQCLRESCRTMDIIGRYGGDEFIAVLPNTSTAEALEICRRIEECVETQPYSEGGDEERRIPIGLSFGAAVYPHDGKSPLELLTVADAHLYDAKRGGSPLAQIIDTEETKELRKLKDMTVGGSFSVLDALVTAIDNKDHYTRRHSEDVMHWAVLMGRELNFSEEVLRAVRVSGLLHDVGKIAVPDAILRKPGRLDDEESAILQQHPNFGTLIVKDVPHLPEVLGGIRHHHERFDGKGYPDKLGGEEIPMMGRLLAVPDCFSAMTTNRPYRKALTWAEALAEIERGIGTQFDPQMAAAFLEVMARIIAEQNKPPTNGTSANGTSANGTSANDARTNNTSTGRASANGKTSGVKTKPKNGRVDLEDPTFPSAYAP